MSKYNLIDRIDLFKISNLVFRGPCTVIYSYNKTNEMRIYLNFTFWIRTVHVSDSYSVHHRESSTVHTTIGTLHDHPS